ncbi:MAG: hypothetical protein K2X03_11550 [Bryobacteraceae bacterium]|nr:hypothetical protein [Bryobacteraceae bacterium]
MRLAWFLILVPACLAQYASLSTNEDGSAVYFTTPLVQRGTTQPAWGKAFRLDAGGLTLQPFRERVFPREPGAFYSNYYNLELFSAGGSRQASAFSWDCFFCASLTGIMTSVGGRDYPGLATLSPNGRFLVNINNGAPRAFNGLMQWDLDNGTEWPIRSYWPLHRWGGRLMVADNGLAVTHRGPDMALLRQGVPEPLTFGSELTMDAMIAANGGVVFFTSQWTLQGITRIRRIDLATRRLSTVMEAAVSFRAPEASRDGSLVMALADDQVWVANGDGSGLRQLTYLADRVKVAVLSANGAVVYGLTFSGRIVRVETATGRVTELLGPTPWLTPNQPYLVSTSANTLTGAGLDQPGVALTLNGQPVPVMRAEINEMIFRLDATEADEAKLGLENSQAAPFVMGVPVRAVVVAANPRMFGSAIHENWDRAVTPEDPARPGEVIHVYALGISATAKFLACVLDIDGPPRAPLERPYLGPAPGYPGFWQLDLVMPANTGVAVLRATCEMDSKERAPLRVWIPFQD